MTLLAEGASQQSAFALNGLNLERNLPFFSVVLTLSARVLLAIQAVHELLLALRGVNQFLRAVQ